MLRLFPVFMLLAGTGAGVGAGMFVSAKGPGEVSATDAQDGDGHASDHPNDDAHPSSSAGSNATAGHDAKAASSAHDNGHGDGHATPASAFNYVKISNQFVVPVVQNERVSAMVVLSLSLEVAPGSGEVVYALEPKLRDGFLQVLFDHANMGGFGGAFTDASMLAVLRRSLLQVARRDLGDIVNNVLIVNIARQDV